MTDAERDAAKAAMEAERTERIKNLARRKVAATLWRRGDLAWKLEEHQLVAYHKIKEAAKNPHNRFVLNASRRWGKSFLLVALCFEYAITHPGALILYAASTQKQVADIIKGAILPLTSDCPDDINPKLKTQTKHLVFKNGAEIKLVGLDGGRQEKIRGLTANMVVLDEAGFVNDLDHTVRSVLSPMGATTGAQTILSSNAPLTPGHDFVKIFTREAERDGFYLCQTVYDIPKFTKEDIDRLAANCGGYESTAFQREYLCKFTADSSNAVIPEFGRLREIVVKEIPRPEFFYPMVALDLGYVDFTGVLFGHWNFGKGCGVIEDELLLKGTNSEKLVKACRDKEDALWGDPLKKPVRIADGNAFTVNDICVVHRYSVSTPSRDNVEAQVNAIRLDLEGFRLFINPRCVALIGQMEDATWNKTRDDFTRTTANGHFDLVAALQYFVRHVNRHSNPFPPNYRQDTRNMVLKDSKFGHNSSLSSLQKLFSQKSDEQFSRPSVSPLVDVFGSDLKNKPRK